MSRSKRLAGLRAALPLLPILVLFLGAGTRQLELPALWPDEAFDAGLGMELALGLPPTPTDWSFTWGGRTLPLRTPHPYDFSAFNIFLSAAAFRVAGVSVEVQRVSGLLVAAGGLAAVYLLVLPWLGVAAASAAALLLALDPAYLLYARTGYYAAEIFLVLPTVSALALAWRWRRNGSARSLCAAAFLLGASLNISTKALAPVLAYPLLFWLAAPPGPRPTRRLLLSAAACGALGAANFLVFNAFRGMEIARSLLESLTEPTAAGVDNLAMAANLARRLEQLGLVMSGRTVPSAVGVLPHHAFPVFALGAFIALAWRCRRERSFQDRPLAVFALGAAPLMLLMTAFTPMGLDAQHLLVLWPSLAVVCVAALAWLRERGDAISPGRGTFAAATVLAVVLLSAARTDASYFARLRESGGTGAWSDALYQLAAELDREGSRAPVSLVWGLPRNIYVLTEGRVRPVGVGVHRRPSPKKGFAFLEARAFEPGARFITAEEHTATAAAYLEHLRRHVRAAGRDLVVSFVASDRAGRPVYRVWKAAP